MTEGSGKQEKPRVLFDVRYQRLLELEQSAAAETVNQLKELYSIIVGAIELHAKVRDEEYAKPAEKIEFAKLATVEEKLESLEKDMQTIEEIIFGVTGKQQEALQKMRELKEKIEKSGAN